MQITFWELFLAVFVLWITWEFFKMVEENNKINSTHDID